MRPARCLTLLAAASLTIACSHGVASGTTSVPAPDPGPGPGPGWEGPTIREGFPVVANQPPTAPPYRITTASFVANAGDTLVAVASAYTYPILRGTSLRWVQRALARSNLARDHQTALYTAVVPAGGVAGEQVWFDVPTTQEWAVNGSGPPSPTTPTTPAQLQVFAFDGASGVGAVKWRGNQGAASVPGLTVKAFSGNSLVLVGGAVWDAATWGARSGALVGAVTNRMGVLSRGTAAPGDVTVSANVVASSWEMVGIEVLPSTATPPTKKLLALGDSSTECNDSNVAWPPLVQEALGPDWALYGGGVWWATSDQVRARWDSMWSRETWDMVTFHVGSNDVLYRGGLLTADWAALASSIAAAQGANRYIVQTIESPSWYGTPGQAAVDAADRAQRSSTPAGGHFFDYDPALGTTASQVTSFLSPDRVHWNDQGNARIADEFVAEIRALMGSPR